MEYNEVIEGRFIARPNRFIALVELAGHEEVCHVKNTGRCRELLRPGARVVLAKGENPNRKTKYDLVAVYKGDMLINMDSQAPNKAAAELLTRLFPGAILRPEYTAGASRLDFLVTTPAGRIFVEVKGVTLEESGIALFPDAPTERGTKHLRELMRCRSAGLQAVVLFLIQMKGPRLFCPNAKTDPAFAAELFNAAQAGVDVLAYDCLVRPNGMQADAPVPIRLSGISNTNPHSLA